AGVGTRGAGLGPGPPPVAPGADGECENGNPGRDGAAGAAVGRGAAAAAPAAGTGGDAGTMGTAPDPCGLLGAAGAVDAAAEFSALGIERRLIPESNASTCARDGCGGVGMVVAGRGDSGEGAAPAPARAATPPCAAAGCGEAKSSSMRPRSPMAITPPHTEHRARTPASGIFAGSTRKIDPHSGQTTFIAPFSSPRCALAARAQWSDAPTPDSTRSWRRS